MKRLRGLAVRSARMARVLALLALCAASAEAQHAVYAMPLDWPRSAWGLGSGQQGVASRNEGEAFPYNPALLANARDVSLSLFRYPIYSWCCAPIPFVSMRIAAPVSLLDGAVGIEYVNETIPLYQQRDEANAIIGYFSPSIHSLAFGYARPLMADMTAEVAERGR